MDYTCECAGAKIDIEWAGRDSNYSAHILKYHRHFRRDLNIVRSCKLLHILHELRVISVGNPTMETNTTVNTTVLVEGRRCYLKEADGVS